MKRELHLATGIIGLVVALLEMYVLDDTAMAISILILTLTGNSIIHLVSEWKRYRRHNAVIASSQFLSIPIGNLVVINYLGPFAGISRIIEANVSIDIIATQTSILSLPFLILFHFLMNRFYQRRYSGFVIGRKVYGPFKLPYLFHLILVIVVSASGWFNDYMDLTGLIIVIGFLTQNIYFLILPRFQNSTTTSGRRNFEGISTQSNQTRSPSRRFDYAPTSSTETIRPSQRPDRRSGQAVSVKPKGGYRRVSSGAKDSKNATTTHRKKEATNKRQDSVAHVSAGINGIARSNSKTIINGSSKRYIPNGSVKKEDLKCMVCYQEFANDPKSIVVLCPECKYPAHELELHQWLNQSLKCPRCAKNIKSNLKQGLRLDEKSYSKIIKKV